MSVIFHFKLTIFQRAQRTLRRIATRSIPFDSIRFHSVPFGSIQFDTRISITESLCEIYRSTRSIPFDSIRFRSIPFGSFRFDSIRYTHLNNRITTTKNRDGDFIVMRDRSFDAIDSIRFHSIPFGSIRFDSIRYTHLNNRIATTRNRDGNFIVMRDRSFIVRCHSAMTTMDDLLLAARLPGWCTESPLFKDDRLAGCEPDTSP